MLTNDQLDRWDREAFFHPSTHLAQHARGEGLLCAVEFVEDKDTRSFFDPAKKVGPAVATALLAEGVIARAMPQGDILGFAPPLCLNREEADTIVAATVRAVEATLQGRLRKRPRWHGDTIDRQH